MENSQKEKIVKEQIAQKTKEWLGNINNYDKMINKTAKSVVEMTEAQTTNENWEESESKRKFEENCKKLDEINNTMLETQKELIITIANLKDPTLKKILLNIILTEPDYAGLDQKAISVIETENNSITDMKPVEFIHEIYVEHIKLMVNKIIDLLKKRK